MQADKTTTTARAKAEARKQPRRNGTRTRKAAATAANASKKQTVAAATKQPGVPPAATHTAAAAPIAHATTTPTAHGSELHETYWPTFIGLLVVTLCVVWLVQRVVLGRGAVFAKPRHTTLLLGLSSSGKTALFTYLVYGHTFDTRTSMQANAGPLHAQYSAASGGKTTLVDYPGHRRLREGLYAHLAEARHVVVVVDAVRIQDDRHDGAAALAELLLPVLQAREFDGVRRLLFACTKRDEITSYSAKAVRQLLGKAMAQAIRSRHGDLGAVDTVVDDKGSVVSRSSTNNSSGGSGGSSTRGKKAARHTLRLAEGQDTFDFDQQLGLPVDFVDVSSFPDAAKHPFSPQPVIDFVLGQQATGKA